ncbi:site-specific DNA-methyltransferase [Paracoccus onubensis]|uniref:site-specific DNA-methyltransferase n=1 Tax=Paracoccus onubensis TaxID=1675788 RepID=UPI00272EF759|nr:site-specific DNA-methyltransferase [Paracoccus onubensis]MDP0929390.1 site-specific DNA-methyltransferase [Paracoccus onubensis]
MAKKPIEVEALKHDAATRKNIPTAEFESVMREADKTPIQLAYERRNRDLDPQLVWRGKDEQDWSDLIVSAPPLYIQEKVHPKVIIDDLKRESKARADEAAPPMADLFADFNGLRDAEAATEFYQHDQHWSNRMISGDSLSVMASLAEREGLRGQVQCIYFDPPYGIKFNSNFQWSTTSRDVKDGAKDHITREPEQVRAFRDTWRDGIHSYLTYLRDRLTVARDLLHESGSIFVQIGDENVHRVRALMDEVFGEDNFVSQIAFKKTGGQSSGALANVTDFILWFAKSAKAMKYRQLYDEKRPGDEGATNYTWIETIQGERRPLNAKEKRGESPIPDSARIMQPYPMFSDGPSARDKPFIWRGQSFEPSSNSHWKTHGAGLAVVSRADRFVAQGKTLRFVNYLDDYNVTPLLNIWIDTQTSGFGADRLYVVQTLPKVVERCVLMVTDPGDLVLDPTCGSGTTAYVAEQWGRRWITIDTSRVAIALARSRLMGGRYPYYLLADSPEGQAKESEIARTVPKTTPTRGDIRMGFVYDRVPHITLKSIANNAEIDVIWERWQDTLEPLRDELNRVLGRNQLWEEWEIPREAGDPWKPEAAAIHSKLREAIAEDEVGKKSQRALDKLNAILGRAYTFKTLPERPIDPWTNAEAIRIHGEWWEARIARQKEIDASIAAKAEFEYLYDKPYPDNSKVRVAGPFTVESLSPHRTLAVDWNDELIDVLEAAEGKRKAADRDENVTDFAHMILENLKAAGVQQAHKEDRITFTSLTGWPGRFICAEGTFMEGERQKRAGIFIGPEFGTVSRPDLVAAAREAGDAGFDVLIACAFNYDAHSAEFDRLGRVPVLKARMNPDLHMGGDLKSTGAGNLFVIFGEPDIKIEDAGDGMIRVKVFGVDVFKPQSGEVVSEGTDGIALWMLDTDYNEESFFVRHAYFLGANDPYKALKTTLKAEIDQEAWESLHSDTSRPFPKPVSGRIAVKVINHLGDEVMKVFSVG